MDLENFPTKETAKDMLSMISPIYISIHAST